MALVTIRILDGPERGKAFPNVATPVSIGREDGNTIQLNDERVSRYHLKIHEQSETILLTDLQSTNGTKVNGESVHIWRLKPGDVVSAGHSILLFGSTEEIGKRLAALRTGSVKDAVMMGDASGEVRTIEKLTGGDPEVNLNSTQMLFREFYKGLSPKELIPLQLLELPVLPKDLQPHQSAVIEELLQYIHLRLRSLVSTVNTEPVKAHGNDLAEYRITLAESQWQNLLDFHNKIAVLLDKLP